MALTTPLTLVYGPYFSLRLRLEGVVRPHKLGNSFELGECRDTNHRRRSRRYGSKLDDKSGWLVSVRRRTAEKSPAANTLVAMTSVFMLVISFVEISDDLVRDRLVPTRTGGMDCPTM